jgi:quinol monooxygenase YgiN
VPVEQEVETVALVSLAEDRLALTEGPGHGAFLDDPGILRRQMTAEAGILEPNHDAMSRAVPGCKDRFVPRQGDDARPSLGWPSPGLRVHVTAMLVVHVHVRVKPGFADAFVAATLENARASLREPGVARFDVVRSEEDPDRFVLVEAYRTDDAPAAHKATAHYAAWRDAVAPMMAEPRVAGRFSAVHVPDPVRGRE